MAFWPFGYTEELAVNDDMFFGGGDPNGAGKRQRKFKFLTIKNWILAFTDIAANTAYRDREKQKVLFTGPEAGVGVVRTLDGGEKFSNWDMIHVSFSVSNDSALNASEYRTIPFTLIQNSFRCYSDSGFLQFGYISDTSFQLTSKTTVGNLGNIQRIIGISL